MSPLALGVSSWSFDDWRGLFYPEGLARADYLGFYASRFNSVEVNSSFYGLPSPATLLSWLEAVPAGFTFALQFPRTISHEQRLVGGEALSLETLEVLRSLGPAAAPGLLQLPPSFSRRQDGRQLAIYLDWLATEAAGHSIAVEVRSAELMTAAFADFLVARGMALVLTDRVGQPDLFPLWHERVASGAAPSSTYIRCIGDDRYKPPSNRELVRPQDVALAGWAERIDSLLEAGQRVYCYIHNPYEGHAPASVRRLQAQLRARRPLPPWPPPAALPSNGQLALL